MKKDDVVDRKYANDFEFHVYFIRYYLWYHLRKEKIETDGSFEAIFINIGKTDGADFITRYPSWNVMEINMGFDRSRYDNVSETERCRYYIELFKTGILRASRLKEIPCDRIFAGLDALAENNYVYSWKFRNMIIPQYSLKVKFTAALTTNDFTIRAEVFRYKSKTPLCGGLVVRTRPDSIFFGIVSKKMLLVDNRIYIRCNPCLKPYLYLDLDELYHGVFILHKCDPSPKDRESERTLEVFYDLQEGLMYYGNDLS